MTASSCDCRSPNNEVHWQDWRDLGMTDRYWELSFMRCRGCGAPWLRAFLEYEAFSRSGRYYRAPVEEAALPGLTPDAALTLIEAAPFKIAGGSRFDGQERVVIDAGKLLDAP
ncbi:MAG: hypothetical protein RBT42_14045 [Aquabacterium sp.]|jgi:hypothetical protein|uniref:hypothetical protein n=1 Tax=Aquabacterium sp. TaxID=1872578 RepID=UPI002A36A1B6|nr:hypothetical protein [Aquabacterium sp.]MDX9844864.1 hypothetical protein [Aquabacterium sp.]